MTLIEKMEWQFVLMQFLSSMENVSYVIEKSNAMVELEIPGNLAKKQREACLYFKEGTADYGVMDFVNNIFFFSDSLHEFIKMLCQALGIESRTDIVENVYEKLVKHEKGFYNELSKWHKEYGGMVVPLYDTDLYYNLIKRIARESRNNEVIEKNELYDYFCRLLSEIDDKLRENDDYYEESTKFADVFKACPVVQKINSVACDKQEIYTNFIWEIINDNYVDKNPQKNLEAELQKGND